jgi:hypothetical protein
LCYFWSFICRLKQMQFLIAFHFGFQVAGILDSILHHTVRMMKKVELGKNFW